MFRLSLIIALLFSGLCHAEEAIRFPEVVTPTPVVPVPPPKPVDAEASIGDGVIFAVQADEPFILLASPASLVTIAQDTGPIRVRGVFADNPAGIETRVLMGKHIAFVEPNLGASGTVELIAIPAGVTDAGKIGRRLVKVGHGPQPPPDVDPTPKPPGPTPNPALKGLRVIVAFDADGPNSREQLNVLSSTAVYEWLNKHCVKGVDGHPEWRKWDIDIEFGTDESPTMRSLWVSAKPLLGKPPQIVIAVDGAATVFDLPTTESATLDLLKSKGGE